MQSAKLGFVVPLDAFDQLPTTVLLRGGLCRRGNLPVLTHEIIAVKIEVSANNVPCFEHFLASDILPGDCHVATLLAMTW